MSTVNSPNMNLPVPVVGVEPGPQYASDINTSLGIIDQHDHTPGSGVPIPPSGININSALAFNNNTATSLAALTLMPQSSTPAINSIYEAGVDLYYVDGLGNNIRITQSGAIAGTPGSIANLVPPASASYVSGSSTFVFESNASVAANIDAGSLIMRNLSPNSTFALTLAPPAALGSNYTITLPSLPPGQQIMTLDNSGNMSAPYTVDNTTIKITSNVLFVNGGGLTGIDGTTGIVNLSISGSTKLIDQTVTQQKLAARPTGTAAGNISLSASTGVVTNGSGSPQLYATANITTTGRPVRVECVPDGSTSPSYFEPGGSGSMTVQLYRNGNLLSTAFMSSPGGVAASYPPGCISILDVNLAAGSYSYDLIMTNSAANATIHYVKLLVYEI